MTDKKVFTFILLPMLALTLILGLAVLKSPAAAADRANTPAQVGLTAWNPLNYALGTTPGVGEMAPVASAPAAPLACTPDIPETMSYWPLDETSGTAFTDMVDGNHGTCTNCPIPVSGKVNGAQAFSYAGRDGILITEDVGNPLVWTNSESFSFEVWVKFTEACTGNKVFFGRYRAVFPEASWWVGCVVGGLPTFYLQAYGQIPPPALSDDVAINDGAWHHVVAVRDYAAGENILYVDSVEVASVTQSYTNDFNSTGAISIGYFDNGYYFDGSIDEVAVYNKALSAAEVAYHYNEGTGQSYCNDGPIAMDDNLTTAEDTFVDFTGASLLANDSDPDGDSLVITGMDSVSTAGGTITDQGGGNYRYTPLANFNGPDTFEYDISDNNDGTATGTVHVSVGVFNDPPVADDQFLPMDEDTALDITLTASDTEGDPLTFTVETDPVHGDLTGTAPDLTYTPEGDYHGPDSFTFTANDGTSDSLPATVSITVDPKPDAPDALDDILDGFEGDPLDFTAAQLLANDEDADGDPLAISAFDAITTEGGTVTDLGGGNYQYSPPPDNFNGVDTFTYTIGDGNGGEDTATVTVNVAPVNDAPVAGDQVLSTPFNTPLNITLTASDPDGDPLTFSVVTQPGYGTLSGTAPDLTYTPTSGYSGVDSFTFKANDGTDDSNVAFVQITVGQPDTTIKLLFLPILYR